MNPVLEAEVSMKSGLEDRNNVIVTAWEAGQDPVSMKSGLEDRNNMMLAVIDGRRREVSMKSGLEDRNNVLATRRPYRC